MNFNRVADELSGCSKVRLGVLLSPDRSLDNHGKAPRILSVRSHGPWKGRKIPVFRAIALATVVIWLLAGESAVPQARGASEAAVDARMQNGGTGSFIVFARLNNRWGAIMEYVPADGLKIRHNLKRKFRFPYPVDLGSIFPPNFFQKIGVILVYKTSQSGQDGYYGSPFHLNLERWTAKPLLKCKVWDLVGRSRTRCYFLGDGHTACFDARSGNQLDHDSFEKRIADLPPYWLVTLDGDIQKGATGSYVPGALYDPEKSRIVRRVRVPFMALIMEGEENLRERLVAASPNHERIAWVQARFERILTTEDPVRSKETILVFDLEKGEYRFFEISIMGWLAKKRPALITGRYEKESWASIVPIHLEFPEKGLIRFTSLGQVKGREFVTVQAFFCRFLKKT